MSFAARPLIAARTIERCAGCGVERAVGAAAACRCAVPRWSLFCTRCAKAIGEPVCPHCLEVAQVNGEKLRASLDAALVRHGRLAGATAAADRLASRAEAVLANLGVAAVLPAMPAWAEALADKNRPDPDAIYRSRSQTAAVANLRLEAAAVRVALDALGYSGRPIDEKLSKTVAEARAAAAALATWDGLAAGHEHESALRTAAESLAAGLGAGETMIDTVKNRNLDRLAAAGAARARAVEACAKILEPG
ncbi:MAG: hypothetical protein ACO3QC_11755 [Phycisphaerales bacterium]